MPRNTVKVKPHYGLALEQRRDELGRKPLSQIKSESGGTLSERFVNRLELGDLAPRALRMEQWKALLGSLEWTPAELFSATGIDIRVMGDSFSSDIKGEIDCLYVYELSEITLAPEFVFPRSDEKIKIPARLQASGLGLYRNHSVSMALPGGQGILPDDTLYLRNDRTVPQVGRVYAVSVGDEVELRRVSELGAEMWLMADNSQYAPLPLREVHIHGQVVHLTRVPQVQL